MPFFDFYAALGLPIGASFDLVQYAIVQKMEEIKKIGEEHKAEKMEFLQILKNAYDLLQNPDKKKVYDSLLIQHYLKTNNEELKNQLYARYGNSEKNPFKVEMPARVTDVDLDKNLVDKSLRKRVWKNRAPVLIAAILDAIGFIFLHYFYWYNYTTVKFVGFSIAVVLMVACTVFITQKLYAYYTIRNELGFNKYQAGKVAGTFLLLSLFLLPSCFTAMQQVKYTYCMRETGITNIYAAEYRVNSLIYHYRVGEKFYIHSQSIPSGLRQDILYNIKVKYSIIDHRVSVLIAKDGKEIEEEF